MGTRVERAVRLYRGLKERFQAAAVPTGVNGSDFTDCPWTALTYAQGRKGVLLVVDVPAEGGPKVTEELWMVKGPKRLMVWGRYADFVTAEITGKSLRTYIKSARLSTASHDSKGRSLVSYIDRLLQDHDDGTLPQARADSLLFVRTETSS